ncbi:MAG: hypothetical protein DRP18_03715 [Candidatus Aenigmatarchaeota archaeon]|nr:MAG: hypothetical protein DRP18_03715 [Candidatus Aenigmarchaeota archaeon]
MRSAQVEFVVIVALLILVTVVVFYAYQSGMSSISPGISNKVQAVKLSVENMIREASLQTLKTMSDYGGYLDTSFPLGSVRFLGKDVPYWQKAGEIKYPNIRENFVNGVKNYIELYKENFTDALKEYGDVSLGEPQVVANFLSNKIVLTVNLPVTIDGYSIKEPYVIEMPSKFSEVEEFATGFVNYEALNRPFEIYTLSSMMISPVTNGIHDVPFFLFLIGCGKFVYKDWWDIKQGVEYAIKVTLAHTYMPGKVPLHTMKTNPYPKYTLVPINGKEYSDLKVSFHLPDNFELDPSSLQFEPDPISLESKIIPLLGMCQSDPLYVKYYLTYPAIVRIKDPLTGYVFQYAVQVYIKDNEPGVWTGMSGYVSGEKKTMCENAWYQVNIKVKGTDGSPVSGAAVNYMGCSLGRTNENGELKAVAPFGIGLLKIYKKGYEEYSEMKSVASLNDITITFRKKPAFNMYLYEVMIQNLSMSNSYHISSGGLKPIENNQYVIMEWYNTDTNKRYETAFDTKSSRISNIPPGSYLIGANLMEGSKALGGFITTFNITEDLDEKSLYVFLPNILEYNEIEDVSDKAEATATLTNILLACGIKPVSDSKPEFNSCVVGYDEL